MKTLERLLRLGQVLANRGAVRRREVGGHGDDLSPRVTQPPPKRFQRLFGFAIAKHDRTAIEVHHLMYVPFAEIDFADRDPFERLQLRLREPVPRVTDEPLRDIPTDLKMPGHIGQRHHLRHFDDVPRKKTDPRFLRIRDSEFHLPIDEARSTQPRGRVIRNRSAVPPIPRNRHSRVTHPLACTHRSPHFDHTTPDETARWSL